MALRLAYLRRRIRRSRIEREQSVRAWTPLGLVGSSERDDHHSSPAAHVQLSESLVAWRHARRALSVRQRGGCAVEDFWRKGSQASFRQRSCGDYAKAGACVRGRRGFFSCCSRSSPY